MLRLLQKVSSFVPHSKTQFIKTKFSSRTKANGVTQTVDFLL
jgi:hypothetical protein